jgi:hypothetical protein
MLKDRPMGNGQNPFVLTMNGKHLAARKSGK